MSIEKRPIYPLVAGFSGIGKTRASILDPVWIDLESALFNKDWDMYIETAQYLQNLGYIVLIGCQKGIRMKLKEHNANYIIAIPSKDKKDEYIDRYTSRGNDQKFITIFDGHFSKWIEEIENDVDSSKILYVNKYIIDELENIKKMIDSNR